MAKIINHFQELIGNTPLFRLNNFERNNGLSAKILAKLEYFNPAGSVKDRIAWAMIDKAEREGKLNENSVIIEPTSGNTGVGLAAVAAARGYKIIIAMPETMSIERRKILQAYGAQLVLTAGSAGMKGAIAKAKELAAQIPNSFIPGQFTNPANPECHKLTTAREIWDATDGEVDIFVAGVGTGGTLSGVGEFLKSQNPAIKVVAVEPDSSPVLSEGKAGAHKIQGIGAGFVPDTLNTKIYRGLRHGERNCACRRFACRNFFGRVGFRGKKNRRKKSRQNNRRASARHRRKIFVRFQFRRIKIAYLTTAKKTPRQRGGEFFTRFNFLFLIPHS